VAPTQGSLSRRVSRYRTPEHGEHTDRLWTNKQVQRCLLKPRYKAKIEHHTTELVNGRRVEVTKTYDGAWTPLEDEETWNGVATTLRDPSRVKCTTFEIAHQGVLDGPGVRKESADLKAKIAEVDSKLAAAARTSPASTLLASGTPAAPAVERDVTGAARPGDR
jgi:hypothetical protein